MNCKECHNLCIATPTKSGPNTGKEYWACPNQCPNIFNGWVNSSKIRKTQNNDETGEELYHGVPKKRCKTCREVCYATIANSGPNKGKEYWACSNRCIDTFNGWVVIQKQSFRDSNKTRQCEACDTLCVATITKNGKNAGKEYWACPKRCKDVFNGWVNEEQKPKMDAAVPQVKKPKLTEVAVVAAGVFCHTCSAPCTIRKSKTVKNPDREFYACSGECKKTDSFNGWVNTTIMRTQETKNPCNPTNLFESVQSPREDFFIAVDDPDQYGLF